MAVRWVQAFHLSIYVARRRGDYGWFIRSCDSEQLMKSVDESSFLGCARQSFQWSISHVLGAEKRDDELRGSPRKRLRVTCE